MASVLEETARAFDLRSEFKARTYDDPGTQIPETSSPQFGKSAFPTTVSGKSSRPGKGKELTCDICNRIFSHKSVLRSHRRVHTGEKPFKCVLCHKAFAGRGSLTNHLIAHTGVKQFQCTHCNKAFMRKEHLQCHLRLHTGNKPYKCEICQKGFATSSHRKVHMRSHTGERPFACDLCPKRFICSSGLKTHRFSHTGEKPYTCEICQKCFSGAYLLKKHMRNHENQGATSTITLGAEFDHLKNSPSDLSLQKPDPFEELPPLPALEPINVDSDKQGIQNGYDFLPNSLNKETTSDINTHGGELMKEHRCDFCNMLFSSAAALRLHLVKIHTSGKAHVCDICLKGFPTVTALIDHKKRGHEPENIAAPCEDFYKMQEEYGNRDRMSLSPEKALDLSPTASGPGTPVSPVSDISDHGSSASSLSPPDTLVCSECDRKFDDKKRYERHRWLCLKMATDKLAVRIRERRPENELRAQLSPYKGDALPGAAHIALITSVSNEENVSAAMQSFKLSVDRLVSSDSSPSKPGRRPSNPCTEVNVNNSLQKTLPTNSKRLATPANNNAHYCDVCHKLFSSASRLRTHKTVHTTARPYKCDVCGKSFKGRGSLHNHMMVHSEVKPFRCQICDKTFTRKEHLHIHIRLHTGDKPYSCNYCGKRFATASHMKVHVRNHTGEKPFSCDTCDEKFTSSSMLKSHKKRDHSLNFI